MPGFWCAAQLVVPEVTKTLFLLRLKGVACETRWDHSTNGDRFIARARVKKPTHESDRVLVEYSNLSNQQGKLANVRKCDFRYRLPPAVLVIAKYS